MNFRPFACAWIPLPVPGYQLDVPIHKSIVAITLASDIWWFQVGGQPAMSRVSGRNYGHESNVGVDPPGNPWVSYI